MGVKHVCFVNLRKVNIFPICKSSLPFNLVPAIYQSAYIFIVQAYVLFLYVIILPAVAYLPSLIHKNITLGELLPLKLLLGLVFAGPIHEVVWQELDRNLSAIWDGYVA